MKLPLSIIIPCYNCSSTLEEAVKSIYVQGLDFPFEVVLVDDCSSDSTREKMKELSEKYSHIKCFYHEINKGGGAARNTGVKNSQGEVIFCLDSDDILPDGTLKKMYSFLKDKNADGVGKHKSIMFRGTDIQDVSNIITFGYAGERIPFTGLIERKGEPMMPLYSTFMHTRNAFDVIGGYPEHHGFDTQAFAWGFLANGLIAYTCPDAEYLHRVEYNKSYYIRERESGKFSLNWFKIFDEYIYLFSDEAKKIILSYTFKDYTKSIYAPLIKTKPLFEAAISTLLVPHSKSVYLENVAKKPTKEITKYDLYFLGSELLLRKEFKKAKEAFIEAKNMGFSYQILKEKLDVTEACLQGEDLYEEFKKIDSHKQKQLPAWKKEIKKIVDIVRTHVKVRRYNKRFLSLVMYLFISKLAKKLKINFKVSRFDKEVIDLVIVTTSKDYMLLEKYLYFVKNNLCQTINKIFLVSYPKDEIIDFCKNNNISFIDERNVLGYGKDHIKYNVNGMDRSGWMFQQLLKLYADSFVETENFLSVCSDTLLINRNTFLRDGKYIFFENEEWHEPYFKAFKKMFGYDTKNNLSFTSHMMIFNKTKLRLMRQEMEKKHNMRWDDVYLSTIGDGKEQSCVSDYDTYSNWVLYNFPDEVITEPLYNTSLSRDQLATLDTLLPELKKKYKTVSFHAYVKNN